MPRHTFEASGAGLVPLEMGEGMLEATLTVRPDAPIGTISPRLYGHFAEHLGRCCYDGLWVGTGEAEIEHVDGFRSDVLAALRELPVPMLRWPGGCYADHYHWRDGIGPPAERPVRLGMSCGLQVEDDNSLGTHEFLDFCKLIGAEPYLAGNVGSGTPQELCDWLEYCNSAVRTTLARERAANGAPAAVGRQAMGRGQRELGLRRQLRRRNLCLRIPALCHHAAPRRSVRRAGDLRLRRRLECPAARITRQAR